MSADIGITPEIQAQAAALQDRIDAEPNVFERIAMMNDPAIPFEARILAALGRAKEEF
jgi:broad specificity phosphatase PhoE